MRYQLRARRRNCPNWSQILPEILHLILQRLPLPDCFAFSKVCASWRSIFIERHRVSRPPPCFVLIPEVPDTLVGQPLWSIHGGELLKLCSPRPQFFVSECIVGSSLGWLVISSSTEPGLQLLNPMTNERIQLPLMASDGSKFSYGYFSDLHVKLSSSPTSGDCVVVATGYRRGHGYVALCRPDGHEWIIYIEHSLTLGLPVINTVMVDKGELYVLPEKGDILVFTFNCEPKMTGRRSIASICSNNLRHWLVESGGELLLVVRRNHEMEVFKQEGVHGCGWVRVESLGDRVVLIGHHIVDSVNTRDLMGLGLEANCIYYYSPMSMSKELLKFSMSYGISERIPVHTRFEWIAAQTW